LDSFEILLLLFIFFYPILDIVLNRYKSDNKNIEYTKITLVLWVPTILLCYLYYTKSLSVSDFRLQLALNWQNTVVLGLITIAIGYLILLVRSIVSSKELRTEVAAKFKPYVDLMPVTKSQMWVFTCVVSVSAGICEELLFRAYLYNVLDSQLGMAAAIISSSLIFGFWHIYLGWREVVRTSIMGAVLCGVYLFTGNIFIPILMHVFIDVYSGTICYFAMRKQD